LSPTGLLIYASLSLLGTFFLTAINSAFRRLHKKSSMMTIRALKKAFFYQYLQRYFFPKKEFEILMLATACAQNLTRFCYAALAITFLLSTPLLSAPTYNWGYAFLVIVGFAAASLLVADFTPRLWGNHYPFGTIKTCAPFVSALLTVSFPISWVFIKLSQMFSSRRSLHKVDEPLERAKEQIFEIIEDAAVSHNLEPQEKKLLESMVTFRDRIAREVMIPRVDLFCLSADTTIKAAAQASEEEGYSRIPIYRDNVDNIIGILMYKDILAKYMEATNRNDPSVIEASLESIVKNVLYTPETKKISRLLQEFRNRQVHLAIVVDEYGGTEGIITIEDILEEIVGEIADEYDEEEALFYPLPGGGGWVVDARMTILDVEENLGIKIPQDGDYDSVGGYIFHRAGTIPSKGFIVEHDDFKMEILSSNDRCVYKVKLMPSVFGNVEKPENTDGH